MKLTECMIQTITLKPGMSNRQALMECVKYDVYGLPVTDHDNRVIGRFSVRNLFTHAGIPDELIKHAHLIGDSIEHMDLSACRDERFLEKPVSEIMISKVLHLGPGSQVIKALALMEQNNTSYLFVVDNQARYLGMLTRLGIARCILANGCKIDD